MSSAVTKNPFAMLDDDDDAPAAAPAKKEDVKRAPNPPPKKDAPAAAAAKSGGDKPRAPRGGKDGERRPPKREFDRHSGTGRGARSDGHEEKKGGHGKGNWGGKGDTVEDADAEPRELTEEEKAAKEAAEEERRKEAAAMTLEEYQKKQAEAAAEKAKEAKAAREPEKLDMKGLKVKAEDDVEEISIGGKSKAQKAKDKKAKELITDLNFTTPPIETASPSGGRGAVLYVY
jgi:plasminogen activator inhibitor 1 RNA-binding protein